MKNNLRKILAGVLAFGLLSGGSAAYAAMTITIVNGNAAGVGFNDPTPVAPVGGNPGTTLGQQRLNAFQYAASIWGATLDSAAAPATARHCPAATSAMGISRPKCGL